MTRVEDARRTAAKVTPYTYKIVHEVHIKSIKTVCTIYKLTMLPECIVGTVVTRTSNEGVLQSTRVICAITTAFAAERLSRFVFVI